MPGLPSVMFGLVALGPAALALLLPDTSHVALPDDVAAAENLDNMPEKEEEGVMDRREAPQQVAIPQQVATQTYKE